ncbi:MULTISPECIES: M23 family metallopeptidase [Gordonia]|jgi:murein DD-endopeptidase MepM/ murein hydrolase activator NlpD|uniref:M23ase beta-sheet core domain-containing protein n=2 Tax=Gordonia alkanivorans TaxID=84096 RepID=F9VX07_9ACTN|nr:MULTISPECIES: M23 family metallopeptidase [Gordonia]AZZ81927.1 M23 family peptidase [Gordonia alkanivorans]ETA07919.1 peptidase M23 [Gordonia alkanivorans CGMCC 6845]MDH3006348.1 M23 family metallopeptidase [Gordonia alkanivorans]MDH3009663.1 M23 family metallopeptidase [Gordonia alkanivorans]MDH3014106.1 M23 family metallopeptidase [Gordonia alkanivorans]
MQTSGSRTALAASLFLVVLYSTPPQVTAAPRPYSAPLPPRPTVVTGFDAPEKRWQPGHRGVDLAAVPGVAVSTAGAGRVRFAGRVAGRPVVSVQHPDGLITTYEPVEATVGEGDPVSRGDTIGTLVAGHPGCPTLTCLHWGARRGVGRDAEYLNPLGLLGAVRVRLKPLNAGEP